MEGTCLMCFFRKCQCHIFYVCNRKIGGRFCGLEGLGVCMLRWGWVGGLGGLVGVGLRMGGDMSHVFFRK